VKKETKKTFLGAGRVAFLARKAAIEKMIGEGYPLIFIYEKHSRELNISYSQFARYVRKYIRSEPHEPRKQEPVMESGPAPVKLPDIEQEPEQATTAAKRKLEKDAEEGDFY
jgi:hypothetical protein